MSSGDQISNNLHYVLSRGQNLAEGSYFHKTWQGDDLTEEQKHLRYKPEHSYNLTINEYEIGLGIMTTFGRDSYVWTPTSFPPSGVVAIDKWDDNDTLKLFTKLGNRARDSEFNGGNFLAEFHQVPTMIGGIANDVAHVVDNIIHFNHTGLRKYLKKHSDFRDIALENSVSPTISSVQYEARLAKQLQNIRKKYKENATEKLAETFLMYDFGISPLVSDAHDSMNALSQTLNKVNYRTRVKCRRIKQEHVVTSAPFLWNTRVFHLEELRGYLESPPDWLTIWHLNDPLSSTWETTPWSFAFDWVIPIQSYLTALDTLRSFHWKSIWKTTKIIETQSFMGVAPNAEYAFTGSSYIKRIVSVKREQQNLTMPTGLLPLPNIRPAKDVLSVKHALDSLSLLVGQKTAIAKSLKF